ncbi:LytTR family DNA-binding domain-containing protein [Lacibacter sp.]|uniref:LytR/AlgR family response regulator transcription factor n=1 Tax=Lacibacter sp. TaxID=1915409 RepID=UPI002B4AEE0E|nr:LytTR family DNA-binding domain-containing protein [Lacibacter sp.]HLP39468.1 LytTR family DNA-binding domain-containing protein [Lacibacter sp.]
MRAILVDDEPSGILTLRKMLELNCPEVQIEATCSNATTAIQKIEEIHPDLIFLDIRMPGKSGLDIMAELADTDAQVIFVTAHNEYLLQALQFSAVDYLMKPVDEDRLIESVQRVEKKLKQKKNTTQTETLLYNINKAGTPLEMRLCLPTQKGFTIVKLEEILYCEAQRSYTLFRLVDNKSILISKPLFDYDKLLEDTVFLRVHKSFLVNLMHIKEYTRGEGGTVIMSNGMEIEVSRRRKEQFLIKVKEFFRY